MSTSSQRLRRGRVLRRLLAGLPGRRWVSVSRRRYDELLSAADRLEVARRIIARHLVEAADVRVAGAERLRAALEDAGVDVGAELDALMPADPPAVIVAPMLRLVSGGVR